MVYVTQEKDNVNILPALKYGEFKILIPHSNNSIAFSCGAVVNSMKAKLSTFNDNDYLLLLGDPVAIAICTAVAANVNNGKVKMLKWDRQRKEYYPVSINLFQRGLKDD